MEARLIARTGTQHSQGAEWGADCPQAPDWDTRRRHRRSENDWPTGGIDETWTPTSCERCDAPYDGEHLWRSAGTRPIYDTESGRPEPGCLYWVNQHHDETGEGYRGWCPGGWTNCDGIHLHAVLPNGHHWDIDSRASNCGSPHDATHRCWVRHGDPPAVHVDKNGVTCNAGAGSIAMGGWHGFLHHGEFTP